MWEILRTQQSICYHLPIQVMSGTEQGYANHNHNKRGQARGGQGDFKPNKMMRDGTRKRSTERSMGKKLESGELQTQTGQR